MTTRSFLGTCRSCKTRLHVDAAPVETRDAVRTPTGKLVSPRRIAWSITSGKLAGTRTPMAAAWNGKWQIDATCPRCAAQMSVTAVAGTTTAHECNDKCMASTSGKCECSCGGRNHGRSFAA